MWKNKPGTHVLNTVLHKLNDIYTQFIVKSTTNNTITNHKTKIYVYIFYYCGLCITEKFYILKNLENKSLLNTRNEFISKCRHQNKLLLAGVKYDTKD